MLRTESEIQNTINSWLSSFFDEETKNNIQELKANNPEELQDSFYKNLEFGTGGMRGMMGVGTNRINKYTLGKNTQGLSDYLHKTYPNQTIKAVIAFDCRHNSKEFAQIVADVFSANAIEVFLFEDLRATPELSFALKHLGCQCGIVLTGSLEVCVGEHKKILKAGDAYYFKSNQPHYFKNIGHKTCEVISACTPPSF